MLCIDAVCRLFHYSELTHFCSVCSVAPLLQGDFQQQPCAASCLFPYAPQSIRIIDQSERGSQCRVLELDVNASGCLRQLLHFFLVCVRIYLNKLLFVFCSYRALGISRPIRVNQLLLILLYLIWIKGLRLLGNDSVYQGAHNQFQWFPSFCQVVVCSQIQILTYSTTGITNLTSISSSGYSIPSIFHLGPQ